LIDEHPFEFGYSYSPFSYDVHFTSNNIEYVRFFAEGDFYEDLRS